MKNKPHILYKRLAEKIGQKAAGDALGISQAAVSRRIRGARITAEDYFVLMRVVKKHKISIDDFIIKKDTK